MADFDSISTAGWFDSTDLEGNFLEIFTSGWFTAVMQFNGEITGASEITSNTELEINIYGDITGQGEITSAISMEIDIYGDISGRGEITSTTSIVNEIYGDISGEGEITSESSIENNVSGTISGTGLVESTASVEYNIFGNVVGAGNPFYSLGDIVGTGRITSVVSITHSESSIVLGKGRITSLVVTIINIQGSVAGSGSITSVKSIENNISGSISGTGLITSSNSIVNEIYGDISGQGEVASTVNDVCVINGDISGQSEITSFVEENKVVHGDISGRGEITSTIELEENIYGDISGRGEITSSVNEEIEIYGDVSGQGEITSSNVNELNFDGDISGQGEITSTINDVYVINGDISGQGEITSTTEYLQTFNVNGNITGTGLVESSTTTEYNINGSVSGTGRITSSVSIENNISSSVAGSGEINSTIRLTYTIDNASVSGTGTISSTSNGTINISGNIGGKISKHIPPFNDTITFIFGLNEVVPTLPITPTDLYWIAGERVRFTTTGSLPAPLEVDKFYYLVPGSFKLSETPFGPTITFTTPGSGVHTMFSIGNTVDIYTIISPQLINYELVASTGGKGLINSEVTHTQYDVDGVISGRGEITSEISTNELIQGSIAGKGSSNRGVDPDIVTTNTCAEFASPTIRLIGPASIDFDVAEISRYALVQATTLENINILTDGPTIAAEFELIGGNLVWVSNQGNISENGVYRLDSDFNLVFYAPETGTHIDQGAFALDPVDGNISRLVIADYSTVSYSENGIYYITYYVTNSNGLSSSVKRRIKVTYENASLLPVGDVKITEYNISTNVDSRLIKTTYLT